MNKIKNLIEKKNVNKVIIGSSSFIVLTSIFIIVKCSYRLGCRKGYSIGLSEMCKDFVYMIISNRDMIYDKSVSLLSEKGIDMEKAIKLGNILTDLYFRKES